MKIDVKQDLLSLNNAVAAENRALFNSKNVFAINIMGSPGAGKTTLLERLITQINDDAVMAVIEGDLATARDAQRIAAHNVPVIQINTDGGCHLDAEMIAKVVKGFHLDQTDLLLIENVGNLVCPATYDLGEDLRMVVLSITEGEDKPGKYPIAFMEADIVILNKMDLNDYLDTDTDNLIADIVNIKPQIKIFPTSCRNGKITGIDELAAYIIEAVKIKKQDKIHRGQA